MFDQERIMIVQFEYNWRWISFGYWLRSVFQFIEKRNYVFGLLTQDAIEIYTDWHFELDRYTEANYVLVHRKYLPLLPHHYVNFDASNTPVLVSAPADLPRPDRA